MGTIKSGWDRKNDRIIVVTFNVADKTFEFSCDTTTMRRPGKIVLQRDADTVPWTFVGDSLPDPPFKTKVAKDGSSITITNDHSTIHEYSFTVTVCYAGHDYTSPITRITHPPMIRNL